MTNQVDLTRNKQLAMQARMTVTHDRAQVMIRNWLLVPNYNQQQADRAVKVLQACANVRDVDLQVIGNWDSVAHCMAWTLFREERQWLVAWSGFMDWGKQEFSEAVQEVFGAQFVGEPFIERLDNYGNAMLVTAAPL